MENETGSSETGRQTEVAPSRPRSGAGSGAWTGITMALLLGMRAVVPLMRSMGPAGRHAAILLLAGAAPVALGVYTYRRREERRREAARTERARARLARRPRRDA